MASRRKHLQFTLLIASAFFMLSAEMLLPVYAVFVEHIGGDLVTAGISYAAFMLSVGILVYFIAKWEDRHKHKGKFVFASYIVKTAAIGAYLFVTTPLQLFAVQALLGISEAVNVPAYDAMYTKSIRRGHYAEGWGLWESMYYIVAGLGAIGGGLVAEFYGFPMLIGCMLVLSFIGLLISWRLVRE